MAAHWNAHTRGVLLASPSNPTGTSIAFDELKRIHHIVSAKGGITMVDEIYLGLSYDASFGQTALAIDDNIISINSFSKYFNMTGWRLGWLVMPVDMTEHMGKLIEFNTSCASVFVQRAGVAAMQRAGDIVPQVVMQMQACRDRLFVELGSIPGLDLAVPDGGMYAFFRIPGLTDDVKTAKRLVAEAGLGLAPGSAFSPEARGWLRWCFAFSDGAALGAVGEAFGSAQVEDFAVGAHDDRDDVGVAGQPPQRGHGDLGAVMEFAHRRIAQAAGEGVEVDECQQLDPARSFGPVGGGGEFDEGTGGKLSAVGVVVG